MTFVRDCHGSMVTSQNQFDLAPKLIFPYLHFPAIFPAYRYFVYVYVMRIKLLHFQPPSKTSIFKIESKCIPPFDSKFITDFRNQHLFRTFRV